MYVGLDYLLALFLAPDMIYLHLQSDSLLTPGLYYYVIKRIKLELTGNGAARQASACISALDMTSTEAPGGGKASSKKRKSISSDLSKYNALQRKT